MDKIKNLFSANYLLPLILVVAAALRFYHIDYQSLWLDEVCSMIEANLSVPWKDLEISIINSDPHPQLYFVFLKVTLQGLGYTSFAARFLSAVTWILGVFSIYLLGKELVNRKVGLTAAFLLAINFFHIYYSQEGRMYAQLLLFTTLSFYFLVRFLKDSNWKNSVWYGVFTGAMLLTQFFGLFVLMSQLFILLVWFLKLSKSQKLPVVYKSAVSGTIMGVMFIPALNIFVATTKKKYAVMQPVTVDLIKQIFKDFAEKSDVLLWMAIVSIIVYFVFAIRQNAFSKKEESFMMLILISWIFITLAIPIIRSLFVTPMIVSHYFIVILPAIIVLVSMGLNKLPSKITLTSVGLFAIVSSYVSIFQNDYFGKVNKTQFRKVAAFINSHNRDNDPLITNLPWHTTFFFKTNTVDTPIIEKSFDGYVQELSKNPDFLEPFWYFGAFGTPSF